MRRMDVKTKNLVMSAVFAALICASTFVIKIPSPLQGYINLGDCFVLLAAYHCFKAVKKNAKTSVAAIVSGIAAECVMMLGYFIYESFLYGVEAAAAGIPFNAIQGAVCIVPACLLYNMLFSRMSSK